MKNPCNECLVRAACTALCDRKHHYTEFLINNLVAVCKTIYNNDGTRRLVIQVDVREWYKTAMDRCEKNSDETNKIMDRYISFGTT